MKTVLATCSVYNSFLSVSNHNLTALKYLVDINRQLLLRVELVSTKGCALLFLIIFKLAANKNQAQNNLPRECASSVLSNTDEDYQNLANIKLVDQPVLSKIFQYIKA